MAVNTIITFRFITRVKGLRLFFAYFVGFTSGQGAAYCKGTVPVVSFLYLEKALLIFSPMWDKISKAIIIFYTLIRERLNHFRFYRTISMYNTVS